MANFASTGPDRENATYHHIAYFIDGYKEHGYSKRIGRAEPVNKIALLCGSVGRLVPRYLLNHPRGICYKVEFYRMSRVQQGDHAIPRQELILRWEDDGFELFGNIATDVFCRAFFLALNNAGLNYKQVEPMLKRYAKDSPFVFDPATDTLGTLNARCTELCDLGYPLEDVAQFYNAMKRKFFPETPHDRPNAENKPVGASKRGGDPKPLSSILSTLKR